MPTYAYKAKNLNGEELSGTYEVTDVDMLTAMLQEQGYFLVDVQQEGKALAVEDIFQRVTIKDIALFCRQYAVILSAGITIVDGIAILRDQIEKKKFKEVLEDVHEELQRGRVLSAALSDHKDIFPEFMLNMIQVGEASGTLDVIMNQLADFYEKENKIRRKIRTALTYPLILLFLIVGVVILLLVKVLPTFSGILQSMGGELPLITKVLLGISNFVSSHLLMLTMITVFLIAILSYLAQKSEVKYWLDSLKLKLPLLRKPTVKVITSRFARSMGILLRSGIPVITAIEIMSNLLGNRVAEHKFMACCEEVREGKGIAGPVKRVGLFPPLLIHMIAVGETTGELDEMLTRTAGFFDEEVEEAIDKLTAAIEPAMIIIMAVVVGSIVAAIMLPMVSIMNAVR
ncbi:type II secretion system F family protein [Desulfitobacterium sp.]|uniref:type II secretion system F family protein n=1 Tax=Desulfitobacterium sp. TaxID=49981 RepID=UPI002B20D8BA|nr:type II secretion system F family protein [Desulfitobacterium sp.]MEA4901055.1 type II secretion system F family protein [Desulfitobacterium sp.]